MRVLPNKVLLSKSDVWNNLEGRADMSFTEEKNILSEDQLNEYIHQMKELRMDFAREIIQCIRSKKIRIGRANSNSGSSVVYYYGQHEGSTDVKFVIVNVSRFIKVGKKTNSDGELEEKINYGGGVKEFHALLFGAYIGLHTRELVNTKKIMETVAEFYVNTFCEIVSRGFGNPMDGEVMRFLVYYYYYNAQIPANDLGSSLGIEPGKIKLLTTTHTKFFSSKTLQLSDLCETANDEFNESFNRETPSNPGVPLKLSVKNIVTQSAAGLGDSGIYILDNWAYMFGAIGCYLRKPINTAFTGYTFKKVKNSSGLLVDVMRAIV